MVLLRAFLLGFASGQRSMLAPTAVSWAARRGCINVKGTPLGFMENPYTSNTLTLLAAGELVADKSPGIPSRTSPPAFAGRIGAGALSGATVGASRKMMLAGGVAGALGAVAGTLGGAQGRSWLADALGSDLPAALIEDAVAITLALAVVPRSE